jgi:hypothetical protein
MLIYFCPDAAGVLPEIRGLCALGERPQRLFWR